MKKLIVITKKFPYFYTEAFLESEYPYLKQKFKNLVFFPIFKGDVRDSCRDAEICDSYNVIYEHKMIEGIKSILSLHFYFSIIGNIFNVFKKGYIKKLIHQDTHYRVLSKVIKQNPELFDDNTIVYSYWFDSQVYALLKIRDDYHLKYKVVTRAHRYDVYDENGEMPNREYCISKLDKLFPISQDAINFFSRKFGYEEKYSLSRLGVDDHGVISKPSSENSLNVLTVAQTSERKRILQIFDTLMMFSQKHQDLLVNWTHFGDGPLDSILKEKIDSCNLSNFIVNAKGRVPNTCIIEFYKSNEIDMFINLSSSEGVPVSIMEALSFGVPVVATNVGGTAEIMTPENGILLGDTPTDKEVIDAYEKFTRTNFDRILIKKQWKETSDASIVFPNFVNSLSKV